MNSEITERRIKEIVSLKRKKGRDEHQSYIVEGLRSVESALLAEAPLFEILATADIMADIRLKKALKGQIGAITMISDRVMAKLSDTSSPSGILAVARLPEPTTLCISCMRRVLVLDGVQDPGNVGTLIRSAAWFGIEAVVSGPGTADFFAPKTVRATMGGLWDVVLEQVEYLPGFLTTNIRAGVDVRIADMNGVSIKEWKPGAHSMMVIGSEANGVSEEVRSLVKGTVSVPGEDQSRAVESLNAAVAGSIIMSHWN
ncbi:MAG: RNA methyltransferase [Bacteroidetes bacterium]|nr:RNA methyltransferase [Bacteroidota bacterium]